jgi:hypothetical protein
VRKGAERANCCAPARRPGHIAPTAVREPARHPSQGVRSVGPFLESRRREPAGTDDSVGGAALDAAPLPIDVRVRVTGVIYVIKSKSAGTHMTRRVNQ